MPNMIQKVELQLQNQLTKTSSKAAKFPCKKQENIAPTQFFLNHLRNLCAELG